MRLLQRYNRINLISTVTIFLLMAVAFYFLLRYVLINQVDENLEIEQHEIESYIAKYNKLPDPVLVEDQSIRYELSQTPVKEGLYQTTMMYDEIEKETNDFRTLVFGVNLNNKEYRVLIAKSLEGTDSIGHSIIIIVLSILCLILVISIIVNRFVLRKLWSPFYETMRVVKDFKIGQSKSPQLSAGNIEEFTLLNNTLDQFISKAEKDYSTLKEFTENAAHELQTPIAVIRSKLDVLIQDEHLSETQGNIVGSAYDALVKLSRLNQSLLLLSKIENYQFEAKESIDLKELIENKLFQFRELWQGKDLQVDTELTATVATINKDLADILLNNFFSNAAKHTPAGGIIFIELSKNKLVISNTASGNALDETKLFNRFYKGGQSPDHHGLGLSIIKQICETSGYTINYSFAGQQHYFTVLF